LVIDLEELVLHVFAVLLSDCPLFLSKIWEHFRVGVSYVENTSVEGLNHFVNIMVRLWPRVKFKFEHEHIALQQVAEFNASFKQVLEVELKEIAANEVVLVLDYVVYH
jgi:hypothetical protein